MTTIETYLETLPADQRKIFSHIREVAHTIIPDGEEGVSYGMPAHLYKGKAVLSVVARKNFLSLYPFSGKVVEKLASQLAAFEVTSGSIHFSETHVVSDSLLGSIITARLEEIESAGY